MTFTEPLPLTEALQIARDRGLLPTNLSSAQIAEWDDEIKRLSVFSARTNHAGYLQKVKEMTESLLQGDFNEATARMLLQQQLDSLGYNPQRGGFPGLEDPNIPPAEPGSLRDLSSDKRTELVLRTQMRQMANRGYREQGNTPMALFTFPAWELIRIYPRKVPRDDWPQRWAAAGGKLYGNRMIAAKDSPVWEKLGSRDLFDDAIGTDYPPFAFGSGMGWMQVSREVCKSLGVPFQDKPKPKTAPPLDAAQISVKGLDREFLQKLRDDLDLEIREGVAKLRPASAPEISIDAMASTVSRAAQLGIPAQNESARFQSAFDSIDQVHGDGPLQPIPFNNAIVEADSLGEYASTPTEARRISVRAGLDDTELALAHEVGHWLDHIGIPSSASKWASVSAAELRPWWKAMQASDAFQELSRDQTLSFKSRLYLLRPNELWARSYAQFIAGESGNPAMQESLQRILSGGHELPAFAHWETADFAPVRAAIRELFIKLGWMQPPAGG